jgi:uncharacterized protein (TIGR03435 family)
MRRRVVEIMNRALARHCNPPSEQVESASNRVWDRVQARRSDRSDGIFTDHEPPRVHLSVSSPFRLTIAAAAVLVVCLSVIAVRNLVRPNDIYATVETSPEAGRRIGIGEVIRSGEAGAMLNLADGSQVEMRAQSELLLERADDGVRIRLNKGSVIVNAAKQDSGHLYVRTKDITATVVGTVFLVNALAEGSRVAVIQGEVHVQQRGALEKLLPGEQATTSPSLEPFPVADEVTWSRNSIRHVALLRQSTSASSRRAVKEFEVASIRVSSPGISLENSGGSYSPGRFHAKNLSLKELIKVAYQLDGFQLSEGPSWMDTDRYFVEAKAESNVDRDQINQMLQAMLVKRFNLKFHREWRESSIYELVVANGGPRLGEPQQAGIDDRRVSGPMRHHPEFINVSVPELASMLGTLLRTRVVDKTGINGRFNFKLSYRPDGRRYGEPNEDTTNLDSESLFTAMQNQLGLKLQSVKGKVDILVVDSADRPTEN